ncbi:amino acid permease [Agrobacterium tumefaciens]|uniref:basic amino acid/polyamine antiporter n=1 Tax=Agrobacterium tumefaciens TaxID=358 RepID=UPI0021D32316|nr:basic amino acid/polyamine antiporter [Agrobacterium tumefaciens]UXS10916.1 amino acid permease [Agrobacterium tumefaciens]UXS18277.1 amino acid permease [Agrobacterium tumefaciens]UXT66915.1 amino acid permease [Agrobacterium tumefaciens]
MSGKDDAKLSLVTLTGMVVGSMVGAGIFSLPQAFGKATGPLGAIIAWTIAGIGMLMVAFVFQALAQRRPDLDAGIFMYAKEGFGDYLGFLSALGYWAAALLGNVTYFILVKSTLGLFFPAFGDGNTLIAVATSSVLLWVFHSLILRGIRQAAALNTVVTIAKLLPIFAFLLLVLMAFEWETFRENFWGASEAGLGPLASQVRNTMLVTVFVFVGIEGASVYSRYARKRADVGTATVAGFLFVLALMLAVTLLSYGIMPKEELAQLRNPSMAGVLAAATGPWGAVFVSIGLVISVAGAYIAWVLLAAEILYSAATNKTMPKFLARENRSGVPANALWLTNIIVQLFLIVSMFSNYAFMLAVAMTSSMILVPYLLVAAFGVKTNLQRNGALIKGELNRTETIQSFLALIYTAGLIYAAGVKYLLLTTLIYAPGTLLFFMARTEQSMNIFNRLEWIVFTILGAGFCMVIFSIMNGYLVI